MPKTFKGPFLHFINKKIWSFKFDNFRSQGLVESKMFSSPRYPFTLAM